MTTVDTKDLMSALHQKTLDFDAALDSAMENLKIEGSNVDIPKAQYEAAQKAQADIEELKNLISMKSFGVRIREALDQADGDPLAFTTGRHKYQGEGGALNGKSLGQAFTESQEFKSFMGSRAGQMASPWEVKGVPDIGGYGQKDIYLGGFDAMNVNMTPGTRIQTDPTLPMPQRRTRVRDLFPVARTSSNLITYIKILGYAENAGRGAADVVRDYVLGDDEAVPPTVDNFGFKPKSNLRMVAEKAPVETIAHWEAAHRNILDDMPQLRDTIDTSLLYGLRLAEDYEILQGSGTNNHLLGILNTPNIQAYRRLNTETYADALRRAATKCMLANFPATGYVLHPNDWETTELTKATGDGQYVLVTNVSVGASTTVWRLPVVETPAIPEKTFLAGAFGLATQLYDRQEANIRIAQEHDSFFIQNAIAILCEERLALATKRPEAMVKGNFTPA